MAADDVFLNVPYDRAYEPLFLALVTSLISLGRKPRPVLEITETGSGRLARIFDLLEECPVSIHDLSRTGNPVRFNMPFELGLASSLRRYAGNHLIIVLESRKHRLHRTLSDYAGRDPFIHDGRPRALMSCVLDALGPDSDDPTLPEVYSLWRAVMRVSREIKKEHGRDLVYHRRLYREVVAATVDLAVARGLLAP